MKTTDFMINDWVKSRTGMNVRIVSIDHDYPSVYEPIPLTHEILEKNGFRIGHHGTYHIWGFCIGNHYDGQFTPYISLGCTHKDLTYVHELQHALRLCGLNSLADNLKI